MLKIKAGLFTPKGWACERGKPLLFLSCRMAGCENGFCSSLRDRGAERKVTGLLEQRREMGQHLYIGKKLPVALRCLVLDCFQLPEFSAS